MADFPSYMMPPPPILLTTCIDASVSQQGATPLLSASSNTWPTNNIATYVPFRLTSWATVYQLLFWVGATSAGNIDVGIYDAQKNKIVSSGSTAMSATVNTVQELNVTDTVLSPGNYLLAASCSTTSGTCFAQSAVSDEFGLSSFSLFQEASALPLPATATPVLTTATDTRLFCFGAQLRSVF